MSTTPNKAEMQFHQGLRLQNLIEKSSYSITKITTKTGIAKSSLYDIFKRDELLPSKIRPILDLLNVSFFDFYGFTTNGFVVNEDQIPYGLREQVALLKEQVESLKKQLADKEEIIELLKQKTKSK